MKNTPSAPAPSKAVAVEFSSNLREITRVMADVSAVDTVMSEIVRDIDEIAFQSEILALDTRDREAAREVRELQAQAKELLAVTEKLGSLVGSMVGGEMEKRRRLGMPDALPVSPSGAALIARQRHFMRHFAPAPSPRTALSSQSRRAVWLSGFSSSQSAENGVELEA